MKILHIIVRHRSRPHPDYPNLWWDDDRIRSIVTHREIAELCAPLVGTETAVRIHRAGSYGDSPKVCCEANVQAVRPRGALFDVDFTNARTLDMAPSVRPDGKRSWYFAEVGGVAPEYREDSVVSHATQDHPADPAPEPAVRPNSSSVPSPSKTADSAGSGPSVEPEVRPQSRHLELLQRGIDDWNFARQSKPGVRPDLAGADLREAVGKAAGRFQAVQLAGADLRGANLAGLEFRNPVLVEANLAEANLTSASWTGAVEPEEIFLQIHESSRLNLRKADLAGADLSRTKFEKPYLRGACFRCAKLVGANLSGSRLVGICFDGADLHGANLRGTDLTHASFEGADLRGADLSTATVTPEQVARAITDDTTKLPVDWAF